jgi:hypothetical protein
MSEPWKLVIGFVGVVVGFAGGLLGFSAVMASTIGTLLNDRLFFIFLVSIGMCGGGAALVGYLFLSIIGLFERRAKRTRRKKKKSRTKK